MPPSPHSRSPRMGPPCSRSPIHRLRHRLGDPDHPRQRRRGSSIPVEQTRSPSPSRRPAARLRRQRRDSTLTPISLPERHRGSPALGGVNPIAIAITPSGDTAYVLGAVVPAPSRRSPSPRIPPRTWSAPRSPFPGRTRGARHRSGGGSACVLGATGVGRISLPAGTALWTTFNASLHRRRVQPGRDQSPARLHLRHLFAPGSGGPEASAPIRPHSCR